MLPTFGQPLGYSHRCLCNICPLFCHANLMHVLTKPATACKKQGWLGGGVGRREGGGRAGPPWSWRFGNLVGKPRRGACELGPQGDRRLAPPGSCLSCLCKGSQSCLLFAADSGDKRGRKLRIPCAGNRTRSGGGGGGGRTCASGRGSLHCVDLLASS